MGALDAEPSLSLRESGRGPACPVSRVRDPGGKPLEVPDTHLAMICPRGKSKNHISVLTCRTESSELGSDFPRLVGDFRNP